MVTHNANLVVNTDSDQVIVARSPKNVTDNSSADLVQSQVVSKTRRSGPTSAACSRAVRKRFESEV